MTNKKKLQLFQMLLEGKRNGIREGLKSSDVRELKELWGHLLTLGSAIDGELRLRGL